METLAQWEIRQETLPGGPGGPGGEDTPEPILAAHKNAMGAWVNADTGRIITEAAARELLGRPDWYGEYIHADKCWCEACVEAAR